MPDGRSGGGRGEGSGNWDRRPLALRVHLEAISWLDEIRPSGPPGWKALAPPRAFLFSVASRRTRGRGGRSERRHRPFFPHFSPLTAAFLSFQRECQEPVALLVETADPGPWAELHTPSPGGLRPRGLLLPPDLQGAPRPRLSIADLSQSQLVALRFVSPVPLRAMSLILPILLPCSYGFSSACFRLTWLFLLRSPNGKLGVLVLALPSFPTRAFRGLLLIAVRRAVISPSSPCSPGSRETRSSARALLTDVLCALQMFGGSPAIFQRGAPGREPFRWGSFLCLIAVLFYDPFGCVPRPETFRRSRRSVWCVLPWLEECSACQMKQVDGSR